MKRQWKSEPAKPNNKLFLGFIVGSMILSISSVIVGPLLNPTNYQKVQYVGRKDIRQEDIQPGNMRVWRDPFDRAK